MSIDLSIVLLNAISIPIALSGESSTSSEWNIGAQWGMILVVVSGVGAAASTPVSIENVVHYECIPRSTSISQATPASTYNVTSLAGAASAQTHASVSALDSEVPARQNDAINIALNAMGRVGGGTTRVAGRYAAARARQKDLIARNRTARTAIANNVAGVDNDEGMLL